MFTDLCRGFCLFAEALHNCLGKLVGAGCGLEAASYAFDFLYCLSGVHTLNKSGHALSISRTTADNLNLGDDTVVVDFDVHLS